VRDYQRHRVRQRAYGRPAYVDAEPVRQHVRRLMAARLGAKRVAHLAGVAPSVVGKLLYGDPRRGMGPSRRIRPATAEKLLAVRAGLDNLADQTLTDATGTRRRLQALMARGWSQAKLATRLGVLPTNFSGTMEAEQVCASLVRAVRTLYDKLWDTPPPEATHRDKIAASRARNYARLRGFVPPQAWDDDTIDDPGAQPDRDVPRISCAKLPPWDELLFLVVNGENRRTISARFGVKVVTVDEALLRARRTAEQDPLEAEAS
jgi:transcriptional regulator with XRE-family HTH domain